MGNACSSCVACLKEDRQRELKLKFLQEKRESYKDLIAKCTVNKIYLYMDDVKGWGGYIIVENKRRPKYTKDVFSIPTGVVTDIKPLYSRELCVAEVVQSPGNCYQVGSTILFYDNPGFTVIKKSIVIGLVSYEPLHDYTFYNLE